MRNVRNKIVYMLSILGSGLYFYINMNLIGHTCGRELLGEQSEPHTGLFN